MAEWGAMREKFLNPLHPQYEATRKAYSEITEKYDDIMPKVQVAKAAYEQADKEADILISYIEHCDPEDLYNAPIGGLTALSIIAKTDERIREAAEKKLKDRQSKNAKKERPDALQKLIRKIVEKNPKITETQLSEELVKCKGFGVIVDIDAEEISFTINNKGHLKLTPTSGLKHRLSRAKKWLRNSR